MAKAEKKKLTPAMRQYMTLKQDAPDEAILLMRMGDFYELFFEDATRAAPLMDIVLTERGGVPMCGVPYHAYRTYVTRVLQKGYKVAMAEQMEDPSQAKGIVRREIVQVITPGTVLDEEVLNDNKSNFLAALVEGKRGAMGLALMDVSTGDFRIGIFPDTQGLEMELHRFQPAECLVPTSLDETWQNNGRPDLPNGMMVTPAEDWMFDYELANERLCQHFEVSSLDGFGCRSHDDAIAAAGAVFMYAQENLRRDVRFVTSLRVLKSEAHMVLDRISQRNLELVESLFSDNRGATLKSVLDQCVTPMGSRMLREWILRPLQETEQIKQRLDAVEMFVQDPLLLSEFRETLQGVRDLERTIVRLNVGSANARDLLVLRKGLATVPMVRETLQGNGCFLIQELLSRLTDLPEITDRIRDAIVDEPPLTIKEGGLIREGYSEELDEFLHAVRDGRNWIAALQTKEQERTGIKSLKVRYNKVFGYYIEVTRTNLDAVPEDYIRKQTLTNAERFITPDLKDLESKVIGSEDKSKALQYELFQQLREEVANHTKEIQETAQSLSALDALASLAEVAVKNDYCRPEVSDNTGLEIQEGRHPVIEQQLQNERFVPNDTVLDTEENQLNIITGPNMAGKSTYIRQVALLVIMGQMGSFVPARSMSLGVVDRVFTRVGAADDIARGQSTFMVEMVETANILNNATPRSLVILDEVGRGTSTFDGLSLAWAIAEYLHDEEKVKARTLFATHYHELTELALTRDGVKNYNVGVREWGHKIIFLRKILPGSTDKSYGVHVARLAGLPKPVVKRAGEVLTNLEGNAVSDSGQPTLTMGYDTKPKQQKQQKSKKTRNEADDRQMSLFDWSSGNSQN